MDESLGQINYEPRTLHARRAIDPWLAALRLPGATLLRALIGLVLSGCSMGCCVRQPDQPLLIRSAVHSSGPPSCPPSSLHGFGLGLVRVGPRFLEPHIHVCAASRSGRRNRYTALGHHRRQRRPHLPAIAISSLRLVYLLFQRSRHSACATLLFWRLVMTAALDRRCATVIIRDRDPADPDRGAA